MIMIAHLFLSLCYSLSQVPLWNLGRFHELARQNLSIQCFLSCGQFGPINNLFRKLGPLVQPLVNTVTVWAHAHVHFIHVMFFCSVLLLHYIMLHLSESFSTETPLLASQKEVLKRKMSWCSRTRSIAYGRFFFIMITTSDNRINFVTKWLWN